MKSNFKLLIPAVLVSAFLIFLGVLFFRNTDVASSNEFLSQTMANQTKINEKTPEEKVYALLDKPLYAPGETVWFSAFVRNGADLSPSSTSEIIRAELVNPKGEVEMEYKIPVNESGFAEGDFILPKDLPGGNYQFKAYSLYQSNEANPAVFTKSIQVQKVVMPNLKMELDYLSEAYAPGDRVMAELKLESNENKAISAKEVTYVVKAKGEKILTNRATTNQEGIADLVFNLPEGVDSKDVSLNVKLDYRGAVESIARNVPVILGNIDMDFFPEGGDLIDGLKSKVAFKAVDADGAPVDVQGVIIDDNGNEVADFMSLHKGLGAFDLRAEKGNTYTAQITFPGHIDRSFKLPTVAASGFNMTIDEINDENIELKVGSSAKTEISLLASVRGKSYFSKVVKVKRGQTNIKIPLEDFPIGVAQITLFDAKGIARAERMAFVKASDELSINIETNKEKYAPREQVDVTVSVKDGKGNPVQTDLALSVVDDQLLSFADDKSSDLMSWMLLESDIDVSLEEASFYFDKEEANAEEAMDYVLMTSGWRRFAWETVTENELPKFDQRAEVMKVAGTVLDHEGNPIPKAKVQIIDSDKRAVPTQSDGYFEFDEVDLTQQNITVAISAPGHFRQEQVVGDYGNYDYQLFSRELAQKAGLAVNERANRVIQAEQLGLNDDVQQAEPKRQIVSSFATQTNFQVVNFRGKKERYNDDNEEAYGYDPEEEFEGTEYEMYDHRLRRQTTATVETNEDLRGAILSDVAFYRVREFPVKKYKSTGMKERTDFRSTVFWDGHLETDENGVAKVTFWNNDAVTSFNMTVEGMSNDGKIGRSESKFYTQLPFSISTKFPVEVTMGDEFEIPVTLTNTTKETLTGKLDLKHPTTLASKKDPSGTYTLAPGESRTVMAKYKVKNDVVEGDMDNIIIGFASGLFEDKINEDITVVPRGFPTRVAFSGTGMETEYEIKIGGMEKGTLDVELQAYPSALSELITGMDGMMKKPYGCFEQSSSCNYPNILALQYLRETNQSNPEIEKKAHELLKYGHERISGFESPNGGFEWFGGPVGHEAISAFAIMQFTHMKEVYKGVDQGMIDRSVAWLKNRRDGKGGWERHERTTWSLGLRNTDEDVFNAFMMYCLSEAKVKGFSAELAVVEKAASQSDDPYLVGMAALAHHNYGHKKIAKELTERADQLLASNTMTVSNDRSTVFGGVGTNYEMEAKSLLLINLTNQKNYDFKRVKALAKEIREGRQWNGAFGPTQTTVLAMRAILAYSKIAKQTVDDGTIAFYVAGKRVAEQDFKANQTETIVMDGLEQFFKEGVTDFEVVFEGTKHPMPHTVSFKWTTLKPGTSSDAPIALNTDIKTENIKVGDQVRMNVEVKNVTRKNQPTPMAIVGIPAGLSLQAEQLNDLVKDEKMAYYEISGNNLIMYFRYIKGKDSKQIPLDLKAEFAGNFKGSAGSAYAYYNDQEQFWADGEEVIIRN